MLTAVPVFANGSNFISPSNPHIRYTGRFDTRNPKAIRFDWPGSQIELRFSGTSCAVKIRGDGGLYDVHINDSLFVTRFDTLETIHLIVDNLHDAIHTLKIVKRFKGLGEHVNTIRGFYIDRGKTLHPLAPPPLRRIEFIGGSLLLGFGVGADTIHCDTPAVYSNADLSFGAVAARELGAERVIIAMDGKGLTRNWRTPSVSAPKPFGMYYTRTIRNDSLSKWNFKSWTPHAVVTSFGVNDFSTYPYPPRELFLAHYRSFIQEVYGRHPKAHVICVTSSREPVKTYVREMAEEWRREGNRQIHFYSFDQIPRDMLGCDWHPNVKAQEKIGKGLAEVIRPLLP